MTVKAHQGMNTIREEHRFKVFEHKTKRVKNSPELYEACATMMKKKCGRLPEASQFDCLVEAKSDPAMSEDCKKQLAFHGQIRGRTVFLRVERFGSRATVSFEFFRSEFG